MKIQTILGENIGAVHAAYRDLDPMQLAVLQRVVSGKVTDETASPRELGVMDQLVDFGLLDGLSYAPTEIGVRAANIQAKRGPRDAAQIQRRMKALGQEDGFKPRRYTDVGDIGDAIEPGDDMATTSAGARSIDRGEIV